VRTGGLVGLWWRLVRFGFRLLYNELAWTYDLVSWGVSLGNWRRWQRTGLPHLDAAPGDLILELGHGTADLQVDLANSGLKPVGIDLSPYMGRIARRKLRRAGCPHRLVRASAMQLPFPSRCFDAAVSTFPTEFIIHPDTLSEAHRVLKPGGRLVFVPNGILTMANPLARFLEWLYRVTGQRGPWPSEPLKAFHDAGFDAELITEDLPGSQVWIIVAARR
jgi:ubiquinone/menaquinone biosynthesis C-methylase UbiE